MVVSWASLLTELSALAAVIALSPLTIIPSVLVLHTARPRPAGLAFLVGWLLALAALTVAFLGLSRLLGGGFGDPPAWASWSRVVIGALLIAFGIYRWVTRARHSHTPGWMRALTEATPVRAGVTGAVMVVVNPKVVFVCLAAALTIRAEGVGVPGVWGAAAFFVAAAASSVAVLALGYAAVGARLDPPLRRLKEWLEAHNAALIAAILVVIGAMVLLKGATAVR